MLYHALMNPQIDVSMPIFGVTFPSCDTTSLVSTYKPHNILVNGFLNYELPVNTLMQVYLLKLLKKITFKNISILGFLILIIFIKL